MGVYGSFSRSHRCSTGCKDINPDPSNYEIKDVIQIKDFLILKIYYPDCSNYEGNKLLVYKGISLIDIMNMKKIDPHFSNTSMSPSPVARFKPDDEGFEMAKQFCNME